MERKKLLEEGWLSNNTTESKFVVVGKFEELILTALDEDQISALNNRLSFYLQTKR